MRPGLLPKELMSFDAESSVHYIGFDLADHLLILLLLVVSCKVTLQVLRHVSHLALDVDDL